MAIQNQTASIRYPGDAVNAALVRIGYKRRIADLFDGSAASKLALDIYGQTRDALLHDNDWDFSEQTVSATLLKQAPAGGYIPPNNWNPATNPINPSFFYEYAYPTDAIKMRAITYAPMFVLNFDPQPNIFTEASDNNYTPAQRVVLCNIPGAVFIYTARVTDLSIWEDDAIESLIAALGRRLAPALADLNAAKLAASDEAMENQKSENTGVG